LCLVDTLLSARRKQEVQVQRKQEVQVQRKQELVLDNYLSHRKELVLDTTVLVLGTMVLVLGMGLVLHKRELVLRKQGRLSKQELDSRIEQ